MFPACIQTQSNSLNKQLLFLCSYGYCEHSVAGKFWLGWAFAARTCTCTMAAQCEPDGTVTWRETQESVKRLAVYQLCCGQTQCLKYYYDFGIVVWTPVSTHFACDMHQIERVGSRCRICRETALFFAVWNWLEYWKSHQVCCGLIWAGMREQQEVKATGQRENEEGRVESRLFQISVREVISMLAGRCSNEESSILRLQSSFPIASCGVVASRWLDELSTSSVQNVDRHVGAGS